MVVISGRLTSWCWSLTLMKETIFIGAPWAAAAAALDGTVV